MFKSVFAKYISAFMLIIVISFTMLVAIITSMGNNYATNAKEALVFKAASAATEYFEKDIEHTGTIMNFKTYIGGKSKTIQTILDSMSVYADDVIILVADNNGDILITSGKDSARYLHSSISQNIMDEINNGKEISQMNSLNEVFDKPYLISAIPVKQNDDYVVGTVFACSPSASLTDLVEVLVKAVIMSSLWVMLAALIAVYFISEKIIGPLKTMSNAAKSFAAGKFDVRVHVKGKDEIAELATAFNNMAESLENFEYMRSTFLANVSHDLRTPMTTISGFIDGIVDGVIPPEKYDYYLNIISSEVKRLSRLVGTLLDISRMQAGERTFNKASFDICEMARQIVISFEQKIDKKQLDVEFDFDKYNMRAYADRDAIYQILYNLCDNAVKFAHEKGKYRVSIHEKDKKLFISVYNEGQGIPSEDLPFVFDRFYKSDKSRGLDKTGVGLGLYIAKTIIDAHNENIWVQSIYGEYCKFTFTLQATHDVVSAPTENV